jgi:uncharacterized repeat protein (TIGR01451 family)
LIALMAGISLGQQDGNPTIPPLPPLPSPAPSTDGGAPGDKPPLPETDRPRRMPAGAAAVSEPIPAVPDAPHPEGTTERELPSDRGAGQTNDNPTGRQEPAVSLEWIGPPIAKVGQPLSYQILVKNITTIPVQQVVVRNQLPAGVTVNATEPKASSQGNVLVWELGTLEPRQEKRLDMQLVAESKGNLACQASVTFTGVSTAYLQVREPKLVLKASPPEKVVLGDTATVTWTVTNPGDCSADRVKVKTAIPDGLEHPRGKTVEFDVGNLAPNESRSVQVICITKAGGEQKCLALATTEDGLTATGTTTVDVIVPHIDLAVTGPRLRYLERPANYSFKATNSGSAPASNVTVTDQVPAGFKFQAASAGGRYDFATRTVSWFLGDLPPGQSRDVTLDLVAVNPGEHKQVASALAGRGLKADTEIVTRVEGLSALLMELVDLDDPVEVGAETAYEIRVTNTGSKTETNLQLICTVPDRMEFRGARGPAGCQHHVEGKDVVFEPLPKLAPRADAIYRVNVRGLGPGDLRFRARIKADGLTVPVLKEESTKVYGDEAIQK